MKAKIWIAAVSMVIIAACSKDKFSSRPTLTFESINATTFQPGQVITIKLRLTDKEGDFLDSTNEGSGQVGGKKAYLFYKRVSYICPDDLTDTSAQLYNLPAFPTRKYLDAFIDINYISAANPNSAPYTVLRGCINGVGGKDDSTYLRIWIKDEAGNVSDTVDTPAMNLIKN